MIIPDANLLIDALHAAMPKAWGRQAVAGAKPDWE
jgi:hypothetical protein